MSSFRGKLVLFVQPYPERDTNLPFVSLWEVVFAKMSNIFFILYALL